MDLTQLYQTESLPQHQEFKSIYSFLMPPLLKTLNPLTLFNITIYYTIFSHYCTLDKQGLCILNIPMEFLSGKLLEKINSVKINELTIVMIFLISE